MGARIIQGRPQRQFKRGPHTFWRDDRVNESARGGESRVQLLFIFGAHAIHLGAKLFIWLPALLFQFVQLS